MLFHSPLCLVQAVLHGVPHTAEAFQIRRIEAKEGGIVVVSDTNPPIILRPNYFVAPGRTWTVGKISDARDNSVEYFCRKRFRSRAADRSSSTSYTRKLLQEICQFPKSE